MNQQQGQNQEQKQVQIKASDEKMKGEYSNVMQILHTKEEFVLDFLNIFPPTGTLNNRVIVSPGHFKRMLSAMKENLKKYEEKFGEISASESPTETDKKIGFEDRS